MTHSQVKKRHNKRSKRLIRFFSSCETSTTILTAPNTTPHYNIKLHCHYVFLFVPFVSHCFYCTGDIGFANPVLHTLLP